jgi:hypothetical protein
LRIPLTGIALLLATVSARSQTFSFGLNAGIPMTDLVDAQPGAFFSYASVTNRYLVGPAVEVRLPLGLGAEFDAIYRHFSYTWQGCRVNTCENARATGSAWELPLLAKYRLPTRAAHPIAAAGIAWDLVSGSSYGSYTEYPISGTGPPMMGSSYGGLEAENDVVAGFVAGAGLEWRRALLHISIAPEIRYTRWFTQHFTNTGFEYGVLGSNQNQVEFMLGIMF